MIILFGGKEYAVGLTWFSISSPAEIDQFKREMDMTYGVVKMSKVEDEPSSVALAPNEYANQVSLAAALSHAHENLIYVCKTDYKDEAGRVLYYLCCVKRGCVTVDGDTMGDIDTVQSLYSQSLMDLKTDIPEDKIECLGTDIDDERFPGTQPVDVQHMVTTIQRFEGQCTIKELKKEGMSKGKLITLAVLSVMVLIMGYFLFKPAPPPPPPPTKMVKKAPVVVDPLTQLMNSLNAQTITPAGLPLIVVGVKNIPVSINGWAVTDIKANLGATTTFNISLKRQEYATVNSLLALEAAGTLQNISVENSGDAAMGTWGVDVKNVPLLTKDALAVLKDSKVSFRTQFLAILQSTPEISMKLDTVAKTNGFSVQKIDYKSQGLWSIDAFAKTFSSMTTMGITSLNIILKDGNYDYEIQGVIYG